MTETDTPTAAPTAAAILEEGGPFVVGGPFVDAGPLVDGGAGAMSIVMYTHNETANLLLLRLVVLRRGLPP